MKEIKGGASGNRRGKFQTPKKPRDDTYSAKVKTAVSGRNERVVLRDDEDDDLPKRIKVVKTPVLTTLVPGQIWRQTPFKYDPQAFGVEHDRFKSRIIDSAVQTRSLSRWTSDSTDPIVYGVTGAPDDAQALYFAAYLVGLHLKQLGSTANVIWEQMYGSYDGVLSKSRAKPTLLVISNLCSISTNSKLEKARDMLVKHSTVPRIVVAAGEDPISFLSMKLFSSLNSLAYFPASTLRPKIEVL